jgi:hypothetical protein
MTFGVNQKETGVPADPKDDMLKDNDEGELESEDLPVDGGEVPLVVSEPAVEAGLLQYFNIQ